MIISNKLSDRERHYLNNLIVSGQGEIPNKEGKVSPSATHKFVVDKGFIVGAVKIIRREEKK
jgi:hypothetical protein